jgi:hypothetical protein
MGSCLRARFGPTRCGLVCPTGTRRGRRLHRPIATLPGGWGAVSDGVIRCSEQVTGHLQTHQVLVYFRNDFVEGHWSLFYRKQLSRIRPARGAPEVPRAVRQGCNERGMCDTAVRKRAATAFFITNPADLADDLYRDSEKEGRNLQKTSVTDGFFWRSKE